MEGRMGQNHVDSAKAAAEADRLIGVAGENIKQVLISLRDCLQKVHKTRQMLDVDPECSCVNPNNWDFKWEGRRQLHAAANSIEIAIEVVRDNSLIELETNSFVESDGTLAQPNRPAGAEGGDGDDDDDDDDDDLLWCDRVCVHERIEMDVHLWCNMPPTILELVFARLPLPQIFELRGLSKQWRATIMSPSFQSAFGSTSSHRFALVAGLVRNRLLWTFGTRERKWFTLPFDFLPKDCDFPVAGDGGLLCCLRPAHGRKNIQDVQLYVCNPLTQAWRKLPLPLQVRRFDLVHMVVDKQTKQYTITVVSDLQQNEHHQSMSAKAVVEVYDSATKTWNASINGAFHQSGGGNNDLFYYKKYVKVKFIGVRAYDRTTGYSTSIPLQFSPDVAYSEMGPFFPVAEHQGQIYWLRTEAEAATNGVWVLRSPSHAWEKLYSVPSPEILKLYLFSLFVSSDVVIIFGDRRVFHEDGIEIGFDSDSEDPENPYFWMLDRARMAWIDMTEYGLDYLPWSQVMFEMRLDGVP